jgi:NTE family protein
MRLRKCLLAAILGCALSYSLPAVISAQQQSAEPRPVPVEDSKLRATRSPLHIGVALEGDGALGEAHIGVLKWFEEHHIPIDYLAGNSMGGLMGGFYSTGKSADELRAIIETANWPLLLRHATPYEELAFRRKEDARDVPNSLQIGLKRGSHIATGIEHRPADQPDD